MQPEIEALSGFDAFKGNPLKKEGHEADAGLDIADLRNQLLSGKDYKFKSVPFELYKRRTSAFIRRENFLDIVCDALSEYKYVGPNQRADLVLACRYCIVLLVNSSGKVI